MSEPRVTLAAALAEGYCERGIRHLAARHGIDFIRLSRQGIPVSELEHIENPMVRRVVAAVKKEADRGQR